MTSVNSNNKNTSLERNNVYEAIHGRAPVFTINKKYSAELLDFLGTSLKKEVNFTIETHLNNLNDNMVLLAINRKGVANGFVMSLISIIWMSPVVLLPWVYKDLLLLNLAILILFIIYVGFYWSLSFSRHNILK